MGTNNYSIDYNSRAQVTIHITALYSSPEYESEPSNSETVTIETASPSSVFPNNFLNIYPNPAKDAFTLESHLPMASIKVYTLNGMMIKSINEEIGFIKTIYASQMPRGLYLVDVITINGSRQVLKLVIEP